MIAPGSLSRVSPVCALDSNTEMMRASIIPLASMLVTSLLVSAETPPLRLSWNAASKVDLQVADTIAKPVFIKLINEQGAVVMKHRFEEFAEGKVSFAALSEGTYQLVLTDDEGGETRAERFEFNPDSGQDVTTTTLQLLPPGTFGERIANPANISGNVISPFTPEH